MIDIKEYGSLHTILNTLKGHPTLTLNLPYRSRKLYKKLIQMTTLKGDIIFDCFCQLGEVLGVASELNRPWFGIEASKHNLLMGIIPWLNNK